MKNQVLSIEQMQELQKSGVDTSKASMGWARIAFDEDNNRPLYDLVVKDSWVGRIDQPLPTFTLQDILELLPNEIPDKDGSAYSLNLLRPNGKYVFSIQRASWDCLVGTHRENSPLIAAYQMLVWCAENGHLETTTTV